MSVAYCLRPADQVVGPGAEITDRVKAKRVRRFSNRTATTGRRPENPDMTRHKPTRYSPASTAPLLTVNEVAHLLGVSRDTVYGLIRAGDLRPARVSERWRFRPADVDRYIDRNSDNPSDDPTGGHQ